MYWLDKWLFLRFYKTPPQYDLYLSTSFNYVILASIFLHLVFAIWIFGTPEIFSTGSSGLGFLSSISNYVNDLSVFNNSTGTEIGRRLSLSHNLILLALLILLVLFVLIRIIFVDIFRLIFFCCIKEEILLDLTEEDIRIHKALCLNDVYKTYQIRKLQARKFFMNNPEKDDKIKLRNYYINSIALDRYCMVEKLEKELEIDKEQSNKENEEKVDLDALEIDFEKNIKQYFLDKNYYESKMKGDPSYNIAFKMEFENYAFENLILGSNFNNKNKKDIPLESTENNLLVRLNSITHDKINNELNPRKQESSQQELNANRQNTDGNNSSQKLKKSSSKASKIDKDDNQSEKDKKDNQSNKDNKESNSLNKQKSKSIDDKSASNKNNINNYVDNRDDENDVSNSKIKKNSANKISDFNVELKQENNSNYIVDKEPGEEDSLKNKDKLKKTESKISNKSKSEVNNNSKFSSKSSNKSLESEQKKLNDKDTIKKEEKEDTSSKVEKKPKEDSIIHDSLDSDNLDDDLNEIPPSNIKLNVNKNTTMSNAFQINNDKKE